MKTTTSHRDMVTELKCPLLMLNQGRGERRAPFWEQCRLPPQHSGPISHGTGRSGQAHAHQTRATAVSLSPKTGGVCHAGAKTPPKEPYSSAQGVPVGWLGFSTHTQHQLQISHPLAWPQQTTRYLNIRSHKVIWIVLSPQCQAENGFQYC